MSKHKLMLYFLTTTLVLPSFSINIAQAKEASDEEPTSNTSTKQEHEISDAKTDETAKSADNHKTSDVDSNEKSKEEPQSTEHQDDEPTTKKATPRSSESHQSTGKDEKETSNQQSTYHTPLSPVFDISNFNGEPVSKFLDPNKYEDGFSLTNLIASLFNFDSDISDYEQPATSSENEAPNTDNKHEGSTQGSTAHHDETSKSPSSESAAREDSTASKQENKTANPNNSSDDSSISEALDAIDDLTSETTEDKDTNNTGTDNQASNESTSSESNKPSTEDSDSNSSSHAKSEHLSDAAIDSILDKYSEDATDTHQDYEKTQNNESSTQSKEKEHKTKDTDNQASSTTNPQLPTKKELEHKSEPAQSFEQDVKRDNTRSTSLFQTLPQLDGNNVSDNDIAVVENKETRDFIKSIAKNAHDIGQKEDIFASVMIAQAILESSSGNSALAQAPNYNLFGIKGSYKGQAVNFNTLEAGQDNSMFSINAHFRKYPNLKASLEDYAELIKHGIDGNPTIYKPTWKSEATTYQAATRQLSRTYATDPHYATKLNQLIKHYNLTAFDKKKMPNLNDYAKTPSNGTDVSGGDFKPFSIMNSSSPYPQGQCTWYVYERTQQFGEHVGRGWGDAHNWDNRAEDEGYNVDQEPKAHTAVVFEAGQAGAHEMYGHVAFVEKVNEDGSIIISESNVKGLGIVSYRSIDSDTAQELHYIEPK
ncbi:amidase domain-containing protein [Staphylococcus devriesei]|uniref:N-acetylmuramoyl-L-alanine amidase n=1 Tax=Staphylococcus devriesei TaxID=586733 RepID=A0A2T4L271_9STAP|nr:amidase domain-containing protein [Staphylococcus devriesei]PTF15903.1 N-acetylmuramoyl-L-alanine amidase [Staphylococcus devriesei]